jgi:hypothetical protein
MEPWQILVAALSGVAYLSLLAVPLRAFVLAERSANARTAHLRESLEAIWRQLTEEGVSREARLIRALVALDDQLKERLVASEAAVAAHNERTLESWHAQREKDRVNAAEFLSQIQAAAFAQYPTPKDLQVLYARRGIAAARLAALRAKRKLDVGPEQ